jgi:hypothetical protein
MIQTFAYLCIRSCINAEFCTCTCLLSRAGADLSRVVEWDPLWLLPGEVICTHCFALMHTVLCKKACWFASDTLLQCVYQSKLEGLYRIRILLVQCAPACVHYNILIMHWTRC